MAITHASHEEQPQDQAAQTQKGAQENNATAGNTENRNTSSSTTTTSPLQPLSSPSPPSSSSTRQTRPSHQMKTLQNPSQTQDQPQSQSTAVSRLQSLSHQLEPSSQQPPTPMAFFTQDSVPQAPEDPLFGLMSAFRADPSENKVDLGIGAYRDDNAKPWVLPVVRKAEELLRNDPAVNHEYLPIAGLQELKGAAQKLIFGADSRAIAEKR
ncbi:Aspartate aminotransferase, cytoplasmic, partial [Ascosphaera atra]